MYWLPSSTKSSSCVGHLATGNQTIVYSAGDGRESESDKKAANKIERAITQRLKNSSDALKVVREAISSAGPAQVETLELVSSLVGPPLHIEEVLSASGVLSAILLGIAQTCVITTILTEFRNDTLVIGIFNMLRNNDTEVTRRNRRLLHDAGAARYLCNRIATLCERQDGGSELPNLVELIGWMTESIDERPEIISAVRQAFVQLGLQFYGSFVHCHQVVPFT